MKKLDKFFGITKSGSTFGKEIIGGTVTFFAMCYILLVNPTTMLGEVAKQAPDLLVALYVATGLGAVIGTLLMAILAKKPYAQAPGMGLNAFFFLSFMLPVLTANNDIITSYEYGMSIVLTAGIIFMIVSFTGLRKKIIMAMPLSLKKAIPAGIGLFIAFIGMQNSHIIVDNKFLLVSLFDFHASTSWYAMTFPLVAFLSLISMGILSKTKVRKFNVILGIVIGTALYYLFNIGNEQAFAVFSNLQNPWNAFSSFGKLSLGSAFKGFSSWSADGIISIVILIITFCLVDMFDTFGTLQGTATEAGMLDENGNPTNLDECLMADAVATTVGGVIGTSTVTTFVESATGISAGAKTGFSSLVVAGLFFISLFVSPLVSIIPSCALASALMYVGVLMLKSVIDIDFSDATSAIPAFLVIIMTPLTYSISNGIGIGLIAYVILKIFEIRKLNDFKTFMKQDLFSLIIAILFILRFALVTF